MEGLYMAGKKLTLSISCRASKDKPVGFLLTVPRWFLYSSSSQLAFFINLQRAVIGPSDNLTDNGPL